MAESMSVEELESKIAELTAKGEPDANEEMFNLWRNLGSKYSLSGRFIDAMEAFQKAVAINPDSPEFPDIINCIASMLVCTNTGRESYAIEGLMGILEILPTHSPSLQNLANLRFKRGEFDEAERLCRLAVETSHKDCSVAHKILSKITYDRGDLEASERHFAESQRSNDGESADQVDFNSAMMLKISELDTREESLTPKQRESEKIISSRDGLKWNPTDTDVMVDDLMRKHFDVHLDQLRLKSTVMAKSMSMKDLTNKIAMLIAENKPGANVEIAKQICIMGKTCMETNDTDLALFTFGKAADVDPDSPDVHFYLGNCLNVLGRITDAIESYTAALDLCPTHSRVLQNLAILRFGQKNFDETERLCHKAIETYTDDCGLAIAHILLSKIALGRGDTKASERHIAESLRWGNGTMAKVPMVEQLDLMLTINDSKKSESEKNGGQQGLTPLQVENEKICRSIESYKNELRRNPTKADVIGHLYVLLQMCCDWTDYNYRMGKLSGLVDVQSSKNLVPPVDSYSAANMFPLNLQQQLAIASYFSQQLLSKESTTPPIQHHLSGKQLRIGYVLTGPVKFPLVEKRSKLNPDRFEVFYYCCLEDPTKRQTLVGDWNDHVIDLSTFGNNSRAAANRIASDGIQILINLDDRYKSDFQTDNASAIFTHRPAPIQVVYRTSLGSTGASYVDYFITDKVASPLQFAYGYSEKLAYMPNGMFVCDKPELLVKPQDNPEEQGDLRRRFHLPQSAVVFGVICRSCHIDPQTFECWCEILNGVPGSLLWICVPFMEETRSNLKNEAKKYHINFSRLVFVDEPMKSSKDLVRTVDILLDTPMRNGGSLMYPMCKGIPIVTLPKKSFLSRLTASMLTSIGCEELIADSREKYVEIAVKLGKNPERLKEMKDRMWENLPNSNLFRVDQYVVDLENLYEEMWNQKEMGGKPKHIV